MRIIELQNIKEVEQELKKIGVDPGGIKIMAPKSIFRAIKLKDVKTISANIIKQEMLSYGGEAATSYGTIDHSAKTTDILLVGTLQQFKLLANKLKLHQFGLPEISKLIEQALSNYSSSPHQIKIINKNLSFGKRTYVMGILNVTPDSFSDGGKFISVKDAVAQADRMIKDGADIIDIGGESTRPGAKKVSEQEEIKRTIPVIKELKKRNIIISIDTRKSGVAYAAIKAGANIINDISGLKFDKNMAKTAANLKVPVIIMHMRGNPENMQKNTQYSDIIADIMAELDKSIKIAQNAGIEKIIIDPGFGFSKTPEQNLEILKRLKEFKSLGLPILIGTSRKSTIGHVLGLPPAKRLEGTIATVVVAILAGADIIRVHDVLEMKRAAKMADAIIGRS